jgi:hypothetical protein
MINEGVWLFYKRGAREVFSKPQIVFEGKASIRFKSGAYTKYVSILKRIATQPSDTRWDFETTSMV